MVQSKVWLKVRKRHLVIVNYGRGANKNSLAVSAAYKLFIARLITFYPTAQEEGNVFRVCVSMYSYVISLRNLDDSTVS